MQTKVDAILNPPGTSRGARTGPIPRKSKPNWWLSLAADQRQSTRQQHAKPVLDALHQWMALQRKKLPDSSATARALDCSLRRWVADDGQRPVDNNWIENQIRAIAIGRAD